MKRPQMRAWQQMFSAKTREKESEIVDSTVGDVMYFFLREDEIERHRMILEETDTYYRELIKEW